MLLCHGRPNPHHKWAWMWIASPFSQQPVSALSMALNWLRIIFSSSQPNKTFTWDKSFNHHCKAVCGFLNFFSPQKTTQRMTVLEWNRQECFESLCACFSCFIGAVGFKCILWLWFHYVVFHDLLIKEFCVCSKLPLLPHCHLGKILLSRRFFFVHIIILLIILYTSLTLLRCSFPSAVNIINLMNREKKRRNKENS